MRRLYNSIITDLKVEYFNMAVQNKKGRKEIDCASWITGFAFRGFEFRGRIQLTMDKQGISCDAMDSDWRSSA